MTSAFGTRSRTQHATILPSFEQQEQHHELHTRAVDAERERDELHARHLAVERQCHELHARAIDAERRCERGHAWVVQQNDALQHVIHLAARKVGELERSNRRLVAQLREERERTPSPVSPSTQPAAQPTQPAEQPTRQAAQPRTQAVVRRARPTLVASPAREAAQPRAKPRTKTAAQRPASKRSLHAELQRVVREAGDNAEAAAAECLAKLRVSPPIEEAPRQPPPEEAHPHPPPTVEATPPVAAAQEATPTPPPIEEAPPKPPPIEEAPPTPPPIEEAPPLGQSRSQVAAAPSVESPSQTKVPSHTGGEEGAVAKALGRSRSQHQVAAAAPGASVQPPSQAPAPSHMDEAEGGRAKPTYAMVAARAQLRMKSATSQPRFQPAAGATVQPSRPPVDQRGGDDEPRWLREAAESVGLTSARTAAIPPGLGIRQAAPTAALEPAACSATQQAALQVKPTDAEEAAPRTAEQASEFILKRLEEPNAHIVLGVIDTLGTQVALDLLARTEQCVSGGGMVVEETGKPRTKGGIFVKLLKDATNLDPEQQARAIECVKRDGLAAKKARVQQAVKRAKRKADLAVGRRLPRRQQPWSAHGG